MENSLKQEEIDTLVTAFFEGRLDPEMELKKAKGGVSSYDLFNSESRNLLVPNLDIIYDGFIRYNRVTLSNRLRKLVEIKKVGASSYKFDDFLHTLPSPVCMALYKIEPLKGAALIAMDSALVFTIVDSILGGTGNSSNPESNRLFTSIELRLMEKIVKDMLADMEKAWAPLFATRMSLLRMEMNPRLVNIVPPEYQVAVMDMEIQVDTAVGHMAFAVPYMTIDPIRDKLKTGLQFDIMAIDPGWAQRLSEEIIGTPHEVSVEMGSSTITLAELLQLSPGDTIMLESTHDGEIPVKVGGVEKFMGVPGMRRGNKAVQITRVIQEKGVL